MDKTQKRWSFIVNILYFGIIIAAFLLFMRYAFGIVAPFVFAFVIAAFLQKPLNFITGKVKKAPKGVVSALLSVLVFALILGLFAVVGARLIILVKDYLSYFTERCATVGDFFEVLKVTYLDLELSKMLPQDANNAVLGAIDSLNEYIVNGDFLKTLTSNISSFISPVTSVISRVPNFIIGFIVSIIATCFMTATFDEIRDFFVRQFSQENQKKIIRAKRIVISSVGKMFKAYASIIIITTAEIIIGLSILKLLKVYDGTHIFLISLIIAVIDIVPVLGTGTVVLPWSLYSFVTGNIGMGIGLLVMYAMITVIRQVIEPKLVAGQVGISPVVTIMAMFIGVKIFGAIGIFLLPFIVIIINLLNKEGIIHLFKTKKAEEAEKTEKTEESEKTE